MQPAKPSNSDLTRDQQADLSALITRRIQQLRREVALARGLGAYGQIQVTPDSDADRYVADVDADLALASLQRDEDELTGLIAAQIRIEDGNYGGCARCGEPIEFRRLLATPAASRCLKCQGAHEKLLGGAPPSL